MGEEDGTARVTYGGQPYGGAPYGGGDGGSDDEPADQVIEAEAIESTANVFAPAVIQVSGIAALATSATGTARVISPEERELDARWSGPEYVVHVMSDDSVRKLEVLLGRLAQAYETGELDIADASLRADFEAMCNTLSWAVRSNRRDAGIVDRCLAWIYRNIVRAAPAEAARQLIVELMFKAVKSL